MEKIAVVGLSCLFPDAENPERFWQNLVEGKDSTSNATPAEFGVDPDIFYGEDGKEVADRTYSLKGGYIRNFQFDAQGYALPAQKLQGLDPIAKASIYAAKQALQNSGYWGADGSKHWDNTALRARCGVILGNLSLPLHHSNRLFSPMYEAAIAPAVRELIHDPDFRFKSLPNCPEPTDSLNARMSSLPSHVVAEALALSPLNFALDAACSSSLYAVELASHYLLSGATDMMLAGAASYSDSLFIRMLFSGLQAYPDNGVSCPFDQQSRGLTPADGVGMLVLKRHSDAIRDGDHIYAVVSAVGLSNDGRGKHLLSPNQKGQVIAFERAYDAAGFPPNEVDYVECHATGTLLGDTTELNSIDEFFHHSGAQPLVGAAKANTGHLLTAAGMVSLIKVILGMERSLIPPTINLNEPQNSPNGVVSRDRIVTQPTPWPQTHHPKRTAINAFGFGGTNAHLILEEASPADASVQTQPDPPHVAKIPMAIVGMDACFGEADGLEALDQGFYDGIQQFRPLPKQRWKGVENQQELLNAYGFEAGAPEGGYIDAVDINPIRYKIPPNEVNKLHPQQLLMLKVADRALQDAGIQEKDNVAVIIAMETELSIHQLQQRWNFDWQVKAGLEETNAKLPPDTLEELTEILKDSLHPPAYTSEYVGYIGNIMPSRISALWDFNAPSFTLSAGEDSALKALEVAQNLLAYGHADAVLVGAVDLAGGFEQVLIRNRSAQLNTGTPTLSFDAKANGAMVGEGAGAVVLKRLETAQQASDRIYAVVDAMSFEKLEEKTPESGNTVAQACKMAYDQAGISPSEVGYLEVCGSGLPTSDRAEMLGLTDTYRGAGDLSCAVGSATANLGHTGVAAAIASLIKTALCLYHRYIPAIPNWSAPQQPEAWDNTPFYMAQDSRGWLLGAGLEKRTAALNHISAEGIASHVVLSENLSQRQRPSTYLEQRSFQLFPIAARDRADLEAKLAAFEKALEATDSLIALARETFKIYRQEAQLPYALTLVGGTKKKLLRDAAKARKSAVDAFETGKDWQTPGGSFFTANPQGHPQGVGGKVAFVYPGAFGCFVGQAQDRFRLFPDIYNLPMLEHLGEHLNQVDRIIYPRSLRAFSNRDREKLDERLLADPITMFESEIGCSGFTTAILQDYFKLQPQMAFGYSLGETSMMLSQGIFEGEEVRRFSGLLGQSALFRDRISGPKNAVRDHWGLPLVNQDDGQDLWSNFVLVASVAEVRAAVAQFDHVYLTQINTANEVVIAGQPESCQKVVDLLKCNAFRAPFNHVIHCPAMASEHQELVRLNSMAVQTPGAAPVQLYSAAAYQPVAVQTHAIGEAIATNLCNELDFPRLVNQVYDDGARIFVEVGAGGTCSRWISENLSGKPHLTTLLNRRGMDDHTAIVRALSRLVSHRVSLDLSPLYGDVDAPKPKVAMVKTVPLGGPAITDLILSDENRAKFEGVSVECLQPTQAPIAPSSESGMRDLKLSVFEAPQVAEPNLAEPNLAIPVPVAATQLEEGQQNIQTTATATEPAHEMVTQPVVPEALIPQKSEPQTLAESLVASQLAMGDAHDAFLQNRRAGLQEMQNLIERQFVAVAETLSNSESDEPGPTRSEPEPEGVTP